MGTFPRAVPLHCPWSKDGLHRPSLVPERRKETKPKLQEDSGKW